MGEKVKERIVTEILIDETIHCLCMRCYFNEKGACRYNVVAQGIYQDRFPSKNIIINANGECAMKRIPE